MQAYYSWILKYKADEWNGVPKETFIKALSAELGVGTIAISTYVPLNYSPLFQPHSKNTHKISDEYWKLIDPKRFDLPVCKRAYEEEAIVFSHLILLTDQEGCNNIIAGIEKLRDNVDELYEYHKKI
jgi:L-glutamine:2-deoxy-scyllo-inosose/3-amino-2,3-dideoxy-scyllo-inosose aminotransferase